MNKIFKMDDKEYISLSGFDYSNNLEKEPRENILSQKKSINGNGIENDMNYFSSEQTEKRHIEIQEENRVYQEKYLEMLKNLYQELDDRVIDKVKELNKGGEDIFDPNLTHPGGGGYDFYGLDKNLCGSIMISRPRKLAGFQSHGKYESTPEERKKFEDAMTPNIVMQVFSKSDYNINQIGKELVIEPQDGIYDKELVCSVVEKGIKDIFDDIVEKNNDKIEKMNDFKFSSSIQENAKEYVKIIIDDPEYVSKDTILLEHGNTNEIKLYFENEFNKLKDVNTKNEYIIKKRELLGKIIGNI